VTAQIVDDIEPVLMLIAGMRFAQPLHRLRRSPSPAKAGEDL
jgi:hypothetical protein